ncbi:DUF2897 family protein [Rheinheimera sp. 4Y26]|uniref:DUF2897 family protein n=1 Tax=Rheinheimera sp. 4Y26 TaxID=2977811 RepID=UPI0021B10CD6|nr:DUF2897 family protein [Rheinheimera sp. 4Y26]MCT6699631.1 DUF2897 family protein [Rheinheimera sp. 4Y26]
MSWTFIGMLLLVVGLIAANLAVLKHGSKKNQRPLARAKQAQNMAQQQKVQASASTAPAVTHDNDKTNHEAKSKDVQSTANSSDGSDGGDS